ncbi:MAG: lauroyl acyltransferase [Gammaproteobacteria bacterium]|nr:lauroyl acyltransferase [Gammaproteobacteria bacterium]
MAEFLVGNPLRKLARKHPLLRQLLWRLDFAIIWLVLQLSRLLPVDSGSRLGERIGRWIGPRLRSKTAIFRENMAMAFPAMNTAEIDQLVKQAWGRAGRVWTEYAHLESILRDPERLQIDIREPVATYSDSTLPSVIVTAHLSNWEVACSALAKMGIPNASLYSPPTNPLLDRLLLDSRRALDCELLPRDNSARGLMRALKQGRTIGMVMDRRVDDGKPIQFFGHNKQSTLLPAKLALKTGCDLVPLQVERLQDAHFRVTFHPPIRSGNDQLDETAQAIDMIQQVHNQFESWIRKSPQDWFCSKRLWPRVTKDKTEEAGSDADIDSYAA